MPGLAHALDDPATAPARLRALLTDELGHGARELSLKRAGVANPVVVVITPGLRAIVPVPATLRVDAGEADERAWLLTAALAGALAAATDAGELQAGELDGRLVLAIDASTAEPELAQLAFTDFVARLDRVRAVALVAPPALLDGARDLRPPTNAGLRAAVAAARLGANPADPADLERHEEAVLASTTRPHNDPDPARRVARRILQRLAGMGKWGGYHTEFSHLARGFAGNDRALAERVGERLIESGLLKEKPSVGQRHVFLDPRRARDVYALVDEGTVPAGLKLE